MSRTNIDIDDDAVEWIMKTYGLRTKRDAVNFALHQVYPERMSADEVDSLAGTGWGDGLELTDIRPTYVPFAD